MKTITLTATNRPHYLKILLDSLRANNLSGYTLYCSVEPGDKEVFSMCSKINFVPTVITLNHRKRGVRDNPFKILSLVFDSGSDFNVYLEDDIILSPDALNLANWYSTRINSNCLCGLFFNYGSDISKPTIIRKVRDFNALGFVLNKDSWYKKFSPMWYSDNRGWDWSIVSYLLRTPDLYCYQPITGRSNHIGRVGGVHASPAFHDQTFSNLKINTIPQATFNEV